MDFEVKNHEKSDFQKSILKHVGVKLFKIRPDKVVGNALESSKLIFISKLNGTIFQN